MITSELRKSAHGEQNEYVVKVALDYDLMEGLTGGRYAGLTQGIVEKIVELIFPEISQKVLSDPAFKDRIVNEVLAMLAMKVANKIEKEAETKEEPDTSNK